LGLYRKSSKGIEYELIYPEQTTMLMVVINDYQFFKFVEKEMKPQITEILAIHGFYMISINSLKIKMVYIGIVIFIAVLIYLFTAQRIGRNREEQFLFASILLTLMEG